MGTYSEDIAAIRAARLEHDNARQQLYLLQLRSAALQRALAREKRGEGAGDPATEAQLRALRAQAAATEARKANIARQLKKLAPARERVTALRERLSAAPRAIAAAAAEVAHLAGKLPRAAKQEIDALQDAVKAAQARRAGLRVAIDRERDELAREEARLEDAARLTRENKSLDKRLRDLAADIASAEDRSRSVVLGDEDAQNRIDVTKARGMKARREADLRERIEDLYAGRGPEELISAWDDGLPITLLPLRIETRWKTGLPDGAAELWVRVYPDDIGITSHEALLTPPEIEHGEAYWSGYRAATDDAGRSASWNLLAKRFGANRAAWVARACLPLNWDAALADAELTLEFPEHTTKPNAWTTAPHSRVLPDRFVVMAWRGETRRVFEVGLPVEDIVILGPSPVDAPDDEASISREVLDNSLKFGAAFEWVRNFDRAVEGGLGFRVAVSSEDMKQGFDRLLVLGIKLSVDASDGQALLEELIDGHHYSNAGFELLAQGTPTNNTDGNDSGYTRGGETGVAGASPARFTPADDRSAASDGQRFADFLGIRYEPLLHVDGAGRRDHAEAVAMNRALYAGTLGYYLDQMLNEVIADGARSALRGHFTEMVTGRGPIAAIRVGNQPYGILPTSSLERWQPRRDDSDDRAHVLPGRNFESIFVNALRVFDKMWAAKLGDVAQLGTGAKGAENLLKVLGLHPTSAEFHQRVGYSYDYLRNLESFAWGGSETDDIMRMYIEALQSIPLLRRLGYTDTRPSGTPKPLPLLLQLIWRHYQTTLDPKLLIDGLPLSETATIKPLGTSGTNYIDWLIANASNANALERQDFGGAARPSALLYMMLHFSLIMESSRAIHDFLTGFEINADELVRSRKFLNISDTSPSVWEVFRAPARSIAASSASSEPLLTVVHAPQALTGAGAGLGQQKAALDVLRTLPTGRLERALVEHLDTLSYRLDAWQTSLFTRRLHAQRRLDQPAGKRRTGAYLGAYGYLENVKPSAGARVPVAGEDNLFTETGNGGYVHAASLNHATAAALLRNGYLTHASPSDPQALAVNLSSGRVQRARYLIEGIRNGQSLETLLGVQFERGLHDWTTRNPNPVILDDLKPEFRAAFPIVRTRVPAAGAPAGATEVQEDHQVVNGLTLARTTAPFPWGVAGLTGLSTEQENALKAEKASIENTLDALRDLLTAESAYQLALGNFDRAAAVLQSAGSSTLPPDIEVLDTPRGTQLAFTQRLAVQFDAAAAGNPWNPIALTERARLEPALNAWLGDLLGTPGTICCRVAAVNGEGVVLNDGAGPIEDTISVEDLDLQPIDFIYLVRSQAESSGAAELETRVRHVFASERALADDAIVRITFADAGSAAGVRSFAEVLPLADRLRKLLGTARPLDGRHFYCASRDPAPPTDNPGRIDTGELLTRVSTRVAAVRDQLRALGAAADDARASTQAADVTALRAALIAVARIGFGYAMPRSTTGTDIAQRDELVAQADAMVKRATELGTATDTLLADAAAASGAQEVMRLLGSAVKTWMGADMVLLPRFVYGDEYAVRDADAARGALLVHARSAGSVLPVEEWLHGVACVRERVHEFEVFRMMADAARVTPLPLTAFQLPFRTNDSWLGVQFPSTMEVAHDTVSMVQHLPQGFSAAGPQCGLLIDEWTESVPNRQEVTGLTFNYNAPNSAPPQAILLAVSPNETGAWSWDDLVDSVLDTFRRAKLRAVEPDSLGDAAGIGTLLPAVVAEFSTSPASVSLDYSMVLAEIRLPVMQMMSVNTKGG
ncbi:MAG: hypothetical protein BVN28_06580 [Nitrospira sp. ST-bin4]|nr:MAG: hypothetical protein BVN28_06580 [Nitrospira sp. ST-bin4]